ncbi:MAG: DUF58 domain-containing protein [Acidobacteriota bacterium]|nr:DUF58 domain-containing protein [Acidobacteriota bacterium]
MSRSLPAADSEVMRRVRRIEIRTRRIVTETLSGSYHSAFRGRGMEFAEVREYLPGDDVRTIDWNVTARSSRPDQPLYVKVFTEERELTVILLADVSGSTGFGSGRRLKREIIAEISALLAFAAIRNRDRVGLVRFSDRIEQYLPPRSGTTHVLRVVREILTSPGRTGGTDLAGALGFLLKVQRKPAVVFLVSDLIAGHFDRPLAIAARRHDLVAFEVFDPRERVLPAVGPVLVEDAERGERRLVDTASAAVRRHYEQAVQQKLARVHESFARCGVDRVEIDATRAYDRPLLRYFHARAARVRR